MYVLIGHSSAGGGRASYVVVASLNVNVNYGDLFISNHAILEKHATCIIAHALYYYAPRTNAVDFISVAVRIGYIIVTEFSLVRVRICNK